MNKIKTKDMALTAVMTAVLCVLSPLSVPIGPIPVTLSVFAIFLTIYVLGMKNGTIAVVLYILLGFAGLPVFSGFTGGAAKILGPTGGYIAGYIPMALIAGYVIERKRAEMKDLWMCVLAMALSVAVLYVFGTVWFAAMSGRTFAEAAAAAVLPFIPFDLIKIAAASAAGPVIYKALLRAHVYA